MTLRNTLIILILKSNVETLNYMGTRFQQKRYLVLKFNLFLLKFDFFKI